MTLALPFLTGFALGCLAVFALVVLLIMLANRPQTTKAELPPTQKKPPPMPEVMPARKRESNLWAVAQAERHCINCGMDIDPKCACFRGRWLAEQQAKSAAPHLPEDIAQGEGIAYRFLDIPYSED
jgi:hypothetical protein